MNYSWARKTAQTGVIAAGAVLVAGAGTAHANGADVHTSDQIGAVSGNQLVAPIQAPINICGIAAAVLGTAGAGCEGGAEAENESHGGVDLNTHDNVGLVNGNQAYAPVQVPVDVSGVAAAVGGIAGAGSEGGSSATLEESGRYAESDVTSEHNTGLLSGNQLLAPIQAPINACGNAVAVAGTAGAGCEGGAEAELEEGFGGDLHSHDNVGLGNGNQAFIPIQAPINVCGNAIAIFGIAQASCEGGSEAEIETPGSHKKTGYTESTTMEAANVDVTEEQLPTDGVPGLDAVTGAAETVVDNLPVDQVPVVNSLSDGSNATSEGVADLTEVTELAGAGLL